MAKSLLPDVDVIFEDGGLGLLPESNTGIHFKIGVSSSGESNKIYGFSKSNPELVADKLGSGPLVDAMLDSFQSGAQAIYCVKAAASVEGAIGTINHIGTGKATYTASGFPTGEYEICFQIIKDGAFNEAQYQYSLDGGDSFTVKSTIPSNGKIELGDTGIILTFVQAEENPNLSFVKGDIYTFSTMAPTMSNADFLNALAVVKNSNYEYEWIHVVGESGKSVWALAATEADSMEQDHNPIHFVFEARNIRENEDIDAYVTAVLADTEDFASPRVSIVVARAEIAALDGRVRNSNGAGVYTGTLAKAKVQESVGKVLSFQLKSVIGLRPLGLNNSHILQLDKAGLVTFREYIGLEGYFITNGRMKVSAISDYRYVETRRVADKAARLTRNAALRFEHSEGDTDGINNLRANLKHALGVMVDAGEIVDCEIDIPENQDIISTETLEVITELEPVPIMRWITVRQKLKNPYLKGASELD